MALRGDGAVAHMGRRGFAVFHTEGNGDCGIESLLIIEDSGRRLVDCTALRKRMQAFMLDVAGDPAWQDAFRAAGELIPEAQCTSTVVGKE